MFKQSLCLLQLQGTAGGHGARGHAAAKNHWVVLDPFQSESLPRHLVSTLPERGAGILQAEQRLPGTDTIKLFLLYLPTCGPYFKAETAFKEDSLAVVYYYILKEILSSRVYLFLLKNSIAVHFDAVTNLSKYFFCCFNLIEIYIKMVVILITDVSALYLSALFICHLLIWP